MLGKLVQHTNGYRDLPIESISQLVVTLFADIYSSKLWVKRFSGGSAPPNIFSQIDRLYLLTSVYLQIDILMGCRG
jgi:hypothetical protein